MPLATPSDRQSRFATRFLAFILACSPALLRADDARPAAAPGKLVLHEWGTFTSFSGSDGVNLEFRPLVTNDLPRFVMNPFKQPGSLNWAILKDQYVARQRMETPVTYFYTDIPRTVNVRVDFPQGMLSDWYPVVANFNSGHDNATRTVVGDAYLDWGPVRLIPPEQFPAVQVRGPKNQPLSAELPLVKPGDHYARARETDSAIVETVDANRGSHFEKFLFYRGLGNFELPVQLAALGDNRFEITNSSANSTGPLFLVRIEKNLLRFTRLNPVAPQHTIEARLSTAESSIDELANVMVGDLTAAGLYEKESRAMVNTWRDSWFTEPGTRLLYLLPQKFTDNILPLAIDPAPDECIRILVGRLETLTPEDCGRLQRLAATNPSPERLHAELATLGRFAEPALQFVLSQTNSPQTRTRLENPPHQNARQLKTTERIREFRLARP